MPDEAAELAALLLADVGPVADGQQLAERLFGPSYPAPREAIGADATVTRRNERAVLLVASDVPLVDVHRACAFLATRDWIRRHGVAVEAADLAAEPVALAFAAANRPPDSGVIPQLRAG